MIDFSRNDTITHSDRLAFNGVSLLERGVNSPFFVCSNTEICKSYLHKSVDLDLLNTKYDHTYCIHDDNNFHQLSGSCYSFLQSYIYTYGVYTLKVYMYLRSIYCMNTTQTQMGDDQPSAAKILVKDLPRGGR